MNGPAPFTRQSFAESVLAALGAPSSPGNVQLMEGWQQAEGGHWSNTARFNPLNTTLREPGSTPYQSGASVQAYPDAATGIAATVSTLSEPAYNTIVADLRASNPNKAASDIVASPWAEGHYGGDPRTLLASAQVPAGTSVSSADGLATTDKHTTPADTSTETAKASGSAPRILATIDGVLNAHGIGVLNPLTDAKVIIARGAVVAVGLALGGAGLVMLVTSFGQKVVKVVGSDSAVGKATQTAMEVAA